MISELRLQQFRCFDSLKLSIPSEGALFIGDNAQGKTSLLEAVCVLVRLQSPRVKRMKPVVRIDSPGFGIAGECWSVERQVRYGRGGMTMFVEGEELSKQSEYFQDGGLIVWMGNDDLEMVRGASEARRRYLDFIASQIDPFYRQALSKYRKALKVKNLLLKDPRDRNSEIVAYNQILASSGDYIMQVRQKLIEEIEPYICEAQEFVGRKNETVNLDYKQSASCGMQQSLEEARNKERERRQSIVGPHRDDLKLLLNGMPAADYASEGQQRTLALALKLGQGKLLQNKVQRLPIYLLDDIFGELDTSRRNALFEFLPSEAQKLITTTNVDWLDEKWDSWQRFQVESGKIL